MPERLTLADLAGITHDEMGAAGPAATLHRLKLVQAGNRGGGRPGTIVDTATLEAYASLKNVVALRMRPLRQRWRDDSDGGFDGESRMRCFSDDGKIPAPSVKDPFSPTCESCAEATWQEVDGRRRQPCQEVIATIIAVGDRRRTYRLDFRTSSIKAARVWHAWAQSNGQSLLSVAVDISVHQRAPEKGGYFSLIVGGFRLVDAAEAPALAGLHEKYENYDLGANGGGSEA